MANDILPNAIQRHRVKTATNSTCSLCMTIQLIFPTSEILKIGRYSAPKHSTKAKRDCRWLDGFCIPLEVVGGGEEEDAEDGEKKECRGLENDSDPEFDEEQADLRAPGGGARRQRRRGEVYSRTISTKEQTTKHLIR